VSGLKGEGDLQIGLRLEMVKHNLTGAWARGGGRLLAHWFGPGEGQT